MVIEYHLLEDELAGASSSVKTLLTKREELLSVHAHLKATMSKAKITCKHKLESHSYHISHIRDIISTICGRLPEAAPEEIIVNSQQVVAKPDESEIELYVRFLQSAVPTFTSFNEKLKEGILAEEDQLRIAEAAITQSAIIFQTSFQTKWDALNVNSLKVMESAMAAVVPQESASKVAAFLRVSNPELADLNVAGCIEAQLVNFQGITEYVKKRSSILQLMANIICTLGSLLEPAQVETHTKWVEDKFLCSEEDFPVPVIDSFLEFYLQINQASLSVHLRIAKEFRFIMGECDNQMDPAIASSSYSFDSKAAPKLLSTFFQVLNNLAQELECAVEIVKAPRYSNSSAKEDSIASRMSRVATILLHLTSSFLSTAPHINANFRLLTRFYKVFKGFLQYLSKNRKDPSDKVLAFVESVGQLSATVDSFLDYTQERETKSSSKAEGLLTKKLICEVEGFQACAVKLGNQTKKNLMEYFKRSAARAFRIDGDIVNGLNLKKRKKRPQVEEEIEDEEEASEEPPAKRVNSSGIEESDEE